MTFSRSNEKSFFFYAYILRLAIPLWQFEKPPNNIRMLLHS